MFQMLEQSKEQLNSSEQYDEYVVYNLNDNPIKEEFEYSTNFDKASVSPVFARTKQFDDFQVSQLTR